MLAKKSNENNWLSISDLMSGLMIVFLLIAISYMHHVIEANKQLQSGQKRIRDIVVTYQEAQVDLYNKLLEEFKNDLPKWGAKIEKETLSVTFLEPEILFKTGKSDVSDKFKSILNDFFPRYINILFSPQFKFNIAEIRIEGHTSSEWSTDLKSDSINSYFNNMELSQDRTLSVLKYCFSVIKDDEQLLFIKKFLTANGLSSSKLVYDDNHNEDKEKSRRVEFRTRTNAEQRIVQILEEVS